MRVAIYAGWLHQWELAGPECFWEDIPSPAGTELGIYGTSEAMARCGHSVTVYMPGPTGRHGLVEYMDPKYFISTARLTRYDVVVAIHDSRIFGIPFEAGLKVTLAPSQSLLLPPRVKVDRFFTYSRWSVDNILKNEPHAERDKFWITRNGEWLARYGWHLEGRDWQPPAFLTAPRNRKHLVWASSPDRGLWHMVEILAKVREQVPDARLTVAYNFQKFEETCTHEPTLEILRRAHPLLEMPGVEFVGHLSQPKLAQLLMTGGILLYPGDVGENYAGIYNNAMAAGLPIIGTALGGVPEMYGRNCILLSHPIDHEKWAETITGLMHNDLGYDFYQRLGFSVAKHTDFSEIGQEWSEFFLEYLTNHETVRDRGLAARLRR